MIEIPETMKAIVLTGHGGIDKLEYHEDWKTPKPSKNEVLIKVHACGMNNADVNTRSGWYSKSVKEATSSDGYHTQMNEEDPTWGAVPLQFPRIQGVDVVGTVVAVGEGADESLVGKRVINDGWIRNWENINDIVNVGYFGSERDGGFAEYTTIHQNQILPINLSLSDAELATFSYSYTTAENMLRRVNCRKGDVVLITGASGGVGSALIQLANRRGAITVALASESKHKDVAKLQPSVILPRSTDNLAFALKNTIGRDTVSVVCDIVGGSYFPNVIDVLERGGRYVTSGAIAGPMVYLDLRTLYLRDLTLFGSTVTSLNVFPDLIVYIERGEIKPMLAAIYPLKKFHEAQEAFIKKAHTVISVLD